MAVPQCPLLGEYMFQYKKRLALSIAAAIVITGCSTTPVIEQQDTTASIKTPTSEKAAEPAYGHFEADSLQALLEAEFYMYRDQPEQAAERYVSQAVKTGDQQIAKLATQLAEFTDNDDLLKEAANVWIQQAPGEPSANAILARQAAREGDVNKAISLSKHLADSEYLPPYLAIIDAYEPASDSERTSIKLFLQDERNRRGSLAQLDTASAVADHIDGNSDQAANALSATLDLYPSYLPAAFALSQVLAKSGRKDEIYEQLAPHFENIENPKALQQFARTLLRLRLDEESLKVYQRLIAANQGTATDLLTAGLIALNVGEQDTALVYLDQAQLAVDSTEAQKASAAVYKAIIFIERDSRLAAQKQLDSITSAESLTQATAVALRQLASQSMLDQAELLVAIGATAQPTVAATLYNQLAELFLTQGNNKKAIDIANNGLSQFANHEGLSYTLALAYQRDNQPDQFELTLLRLIERNPEHAHALNALGYFWIDNNLRFEQAYLLVSRANELLPDTAAIIDSLGWYHYKVGELVTAIELLTQAYQKSTDPEIASHLATALRAVGRNDQAEIIYRHALRYHPESEILKRLSVQLGI